MQQSTNKTLGTGQMGAFENLQSSNNKSVHNSIYQCRLRRAHTVGDCLTNSKVTKILWENSSGEFLDIMICRVSTFQGRKTKPK